VDVPDFEAEGGAAQAVKLDVQPGLVTRLLSGQNNFELATMTKIARALDCGFRCHLEPLEKKPVRFKVLNGGMSSPKSISRLLPAPARPLPARARCRSCSPRCRSCLPFVRPLR
jgi:hypothetical protein